MAPKTFVARAPVRVDPAGGGTDAPPFSVEHGGAVVNFGISHYIYAHLEVTEDMPEAVIRSEDFDTEVRADSLDALKPEGDLTLLIGIARRMSPPWGFRLTIRSDVRPGSGLGSSGALGVACVGVFDAAMGVKRTPQETAELANAIERRDLGLAGGSQDSYGAAFGGINLITYRKGGGASHRSLNVPQSILGELERRCVLVYTGEVHLSGSIHTDIKRGYALPNSPTVDALKNLARIAQESAAALEAGDVDRFGELLNDNWTHHKRLHESCDSAVLGRFYDAAAEHIVGGKTCGAGGGGCVLFLAKDGHRRALERTCTDLGGTLLHFGIAPHGLLTWPLHKKA